MIRAFHQVKSSPFMLIVAFCLFGASSLGMAAEDFIAARQAAQRRARQMARELVTTVIDGQLRQLEENGLAGDPIHEELETLRREIDRIVDGPMARIIEQLVEAERATGPARQRRYAAARESTREVVRQLSAVRQRVLRRIRSAELLGQVEQLLKLQRRAREGTQSLSELPAQRRAARAVELIADQRDIAPLFARLVESLEEVATWDGEIALSASAARRGIAEMDLDAELRRAEAALQRADYAAALASQNLLLSRFEEIWNRLDAAARRREQAGGDLLERVKGLLARQRILNEEMTAAGQSAPPPLPLVEGQQTLAHELAKLAESFQDDSTLLPLQQQAVTAARAATEALFLEKMRAGLAEQARVVDRLKTLVDLLASERATPRDRSAAEFAEAIARLEQVRSALTEIVAASAGLEPDERAALAERLEQLAGELPEARAIAARMAQAAQAMRDRLDPQPSLEQAQAAIEETLADWKRAEIAVRIGELARAAEALERAAAAERSLARSVAERGGGGEGGRGGQTKAHFTEEERATWSKIHADVMAVARSSQEGVRSAAPEAARQLVESIAVGEQVTDAITHQQHLNGELADSADKMSQSLSNAAATLRRAIGQSANDLVGLAEAQMAPVARASESVETAAEAANSGQSAHLTELTREAAARAALADFASTLAAQAAERAVAENNIRDTSAAFERATIALAARQKQLAQARRLSEQLGELASRQQDAVETIGQSREELADAPGQPAEMSPAQRQSARQMRSATQQFAATQRATGEAAARISQQRQLANAAIREALQAAGRLPNPQPSSAEPAGQATAQSATTQQTPAGESTSPPSSNGQPPGASQASDTKTASSGASGQKQVGASASGDGSSGGKAMGTEIVPAAPQETARMMAGAQAQAAMAAMAAAGATSDQIAASESGSPSVEGAMDRRGDGGPKGDAEDVSADGPIASTEGAPPADGATQPGERGGDATIPGNGDGQSGWFAKLPPDVRAAIRANSTKPAPPGYEQTLKRYFESIEE